MPKGLFRLPQCLLGLLGILVVGVLVPACSPARVRALLPLCHRGLPS